MHPARNPHDHPIREQKGIQKMSAIENIFQSIAEHVLYAEKKHPGWPDDQIHAVGIITEEVGEAMKEAIDYTYFTDGRIEQAVILEKLERELFQSAAVCVRALIAIQRKSR